MKQKLRVLVACESSGTVRRAFRKLGHAAWSCDLLPADDGDPHHVQGNALNLLTRDGSNMFCAVDAWDLLIAHPPCTYLCNSGVRWLWNAKRPVIRRWIEMRKAANFFYRWWSATVPYIAVENPIPHNYGKLPRYNQIVQPWWFGHGETKATCLWLKNLPPLVATDVVRGREQRIHNMSPGPDRWKQRSKTYDGIAEAMAVQWSAHIIAENQKGK